MPDAQLAGTGGRNKPDVSYPRADQARFRQGTILRPGEASDVTRPGCAERQRYRMEGCIQMNLDKYLSRIEVNPREVRSDVETLRLLQRQHLLHVPFENLDIHWKRPIVLDTERLYKKIVVNGRGGFCYELNGLFNELLTSVGFHTHLVSGRVYNAERKLGPEFDHMAIVVLLNGEYLADVGLVIYRRAAQDNHQRAG